MINLVDRVRYLQLSKNIHLWMYYIWNTSYICFLYYLWIFQIIIWGSANLALSIIIINFLLRYIFWELYSEFRVIQNWKVPWSNFMVHWTVLLDSTLLRVFWWSLIRSVVTNLLIAGVGKASDLKLTFKAINYVKIFFEWQRAFQSTWSQINEFKYFIKYMIYLILQKSTGLTIFYSRIWMLYWKTRSAPLNCNKYNILQ